MSSTYSNLKFQLMATGENSATWGNVTNLNLGTAIEEAITGSVDVAFSSANVTLTLTDTNASQTARNLRLNLTGTATAGFNLVVPAIEKAYIVNNGTDGTVTVKNATGTGIAVPTGKTMWVFNDGTNVKDVVTTLTSLTLATALPATSGGTGQNVYAVGDLVYASTTTALSKLADVATGSALISGGVGVAPSYGKIGLTTHISGTLPVANGGTNATTSGAALTNLGAAASGANTDLTSISPTGSLTLNPTTGTLIGAPTGGVKGAGTINATGLYVNGAAVGTGTGSVSSVAMTVPTFLSVTGSPITTSGTLAVSLSGTALPVANGGTGQTTYTDGQLLIGNTTGSTLAKATLTAGTGVSITNGAGSITIAATGGTGTVTSVSFTGGIVSVATATSTPAFTVAGTSGGIPYFSSASTWATSAVLAANAIVVGGGAGVAPSTAPTGTGVVTALGVAVGSAGSFVVSGGALGTPSSGTLTNCTFPTLNQSTTGSAATLTTARTITVGATGRSFDGSANISWALSDIGAAASGANTDITALNQSVTVTATGTIAANTLGYRGIPQNAQTASYTLALSDAGKHISITTGGVIVPANSGVAFPIGTTISVYNNSGSSQNISITTDTMYLAGTATTGTRALAQRGVATILKVNTTEWVISGGGLT